MNGDCFYFCDIILSESVCTVYYCCGLFLMAKHVATQMSCVNSFVYLWYTFMYLDGALIILTVCKMKLCAAESVALWVVLGRADVVGEFRQCLAHSNKYF
jgi:hypothetical protein